MAKTKQLTKEQVIQAGTASGTYETRLELGQEVKRILGHYLQVLDDGGLVVARIKLSYANSAKTIFEPTTIKHFVVGENVQIKDRYYKEDPFDVEGFIQSKLTIPSAVGGSDLVVQHLLFVETN